MDAPSDTSRELQPPIQDRIEEELVEQALETTFHMTGVAQYLEYLEWK